MYNVKVNRLDINDNHEFRLKDTCTYTIETSINTIPNSIHYQKYRLIYSLGDHDYRFSPESSIVINNFSSYLPENVTTDSYEIWLPFDVLPNVDGYIEVTQSSGQIPVVGLSGTHHERTPGLII